MLIEFKHANVTGAPRAAEERQQRAPLRSINKIFPAVVFFLSISISVVKGKYDLKG